MIATDVGPAGVALGRPTADPIIGLFIAAAILLVLRTATRDVLRRLMDGIDPAVVDAAEHALPGTNGVQGIARRRIRWLGHTPQVEAHVDVDPELTQAQAHDVAHRAQARPLARVRKLAGATIHAVPTGAHRAAVG